jgi:hypothetical protein
VFCCPDSINVSLFYYKTITKINKEVEHCCFQYNWENFTEGIDRWRSLLNTLFFPSLRLADTTTDREQERYLHRRYREFCIPRQKRENWKEEKRYEIACQRVKHVWVCVFFNGAVNYYANKASAIDEWMSRVGVLIPTEKQTYSEKNLSLYHFVYHKYHTDAFRIQPGSLRSEADGLSRRTAWQNLGMSISLRLKIPNTHWKTKISECTKISSSYTEDFLVFHVWRRSCKG